MHQALRIQEILLNIFGQDVYFDARDLASLAWTCRAFKEPALDFLWSTLRDISPLARCLPGASRRRDENNPRSTYVFTKPLTQAEWDILRSYTCRIRVICRFDFGVDWESFRTELTPSIPSSLFPNLHSAYCGDWNGNTIGQLPPRQPLPSLLCVHILYPRPAVPVLQRCLTWFTELSPNVKTVSVRPASIFKHGGFVEISVEHIYGWRHLEQLECPYVTIDENTLVHLSRIPTLTKLNFLPTLFTTLSIFSTPTPTPSNPPPLFSNLRSMVVNVRHPPFPLLDSILKLLAYIRFPAIENIDVATPDYLPGCVGSFLSALETANVNHTIMRVSFFCSDTTHPRMTILTFDDVRPIMMFSNLHYLNLDVSCNVGFTDDDLVMLASAFPYLEHLEINSHFGWGTQVVSGITPDGLFRVLQACPLLTHVCVALDTRGYTQVPPDQSSAMLQFQSQNKSLFLLDVVDSVIEEESVQAMATYIAGISLRASHVSMSWRFDSYHGRLQRVYLQRWDKVCHQVILMRQQPKADSAVSSSCKIL